MNSRSIKFSVTVALSLLVLLMLFLPVLAQSGPTAGLLSPGQILAGGQLINERL